MVTTAECKKFLVEFVQSNPSIVLSIYGFQEGSKNAIELVNLATNAKNWVRRYKCKPGNSDYEFDEYSLFSKTTKIARMGYQRPERVVSKDKFINERGFELKDTDSGVAFVVLDDSEGNLYLGDYIGD